MELKDLRPNPSNPRQITPEKLKALEKSMREFGDLSGVVFNQTTGQLVGGHQRKDIFGEDARLHVTKRYEVPSRVGTIAEGYILANGERFSYREVKWNETKEKAANIAANKGAGEWDASKLTEWFNELNDFGFNLDLTMFDELERKAYLSNGTVGNIDDDEVPEVKEENEFGVKLGEVWLLGKHRLMCGDSTNPDSVSTLMNGEKADMVFTSPPYNADTQFTNVKNAGKLYNNYEDNLSEVDYVKFASSVLELMLEHTNGFVFWNVNYNSNVRSAFLKQIIPFLDKLSETIVWKKTALPVPHGLTRTWEPIFVFSTLDKKVRLGNPNVTEFNFWEIGNNNALNKDHRAAFPVELVSKALSLYEGGIILEPFCGSGTTLIACEKTNRKCYGMEIDPHYCSVIIKRWQEFTGKTAQLQKPKTIKRKDAQR